MKEERTKEILEMEEAIRHFALGLFPGGCKFYSENRELSLGGELLAAIIIDKRGKEKKEISPCEGCSYYQDCEKEGRFKPKEDRLNTENLKTRLLTKEETIMMAKLLMFPFDDTTDWVFDPDNESDPNAKDGELEIPWIVRVIRKRILGESLKIEITKKAYFLLAVLTEGNPGKAMFIIHKIGNLFEKIRAQRWLVTSQIVTSSLFPFGVSTEKAWSEWWDGQKMSRVGWSDNKVDIFPDEWREVRTPAV